MGAIQVAERTCGRGGHRHRKLRREVDVGPATYAVGAEQTSHVYILPVGAAARRETTPMRSLPSTRAVPGQSPYEEKAHDRTVPRDDPVALAWQGGQHRTRMTSASSTAAPCGPS